MNEERQKLFDEFMEEFVKLEYSRKNDEIIEKQKKVIAFLVKYATDRGIPVSLLKSREINDILDGNGTNVDYLEAIMVYLQNIEDLIGTILQSM